MEFILSALFLFCVFGLPNIIRGNRTTNYLNSHAGKIDYGKMNDDRIMNDLSNSQVNQNLLSGKYDKR